MVRRMGRRSRRVPIRSRREGSAGADGAVDAPLEVGAAAQRPGPPPAPPTRRRPVIAPPRPITGLHRAPARSPAPPANRPHPRRSRQRSTVAARHERHTPKPAPPRTKQVLLDADLARADVAGTERQTPHRAHAARSTAPRRHALPSHPGQHPATRQHARAPKLPPPPAPSRPAHLQGPPRPRNQYRKQSITRLALLSSTPLPFSRTSLPTTIGNPSALVYNS